MFFMIKFSIYFTISFLILSMPIKDRSLFSQIHEVTDPITYEILGAIKSKVQRTTRDLKDVSKRAFSNTSPTNEELEKHQDQVNSTLSSSYKEEYIRGHGDYTVEEKESLLKVLKEKAQ